MQVYFVFHSLLAFVRSNPIKRRAYDHCALQFFLDAKKALRSYQSEKTFAVAHLHTLPQARDCSDARPAVFVSRPQGDVVSELGLFVKDCGLGAKVATRQTNQVRADQKSQESKFPVQPSEISSCASAQVQMEDRHAPHFIGKAPQILQRINRSSQSGQMLQRSLDGNRSGYADLIVACLKSFWASDRASYMSHCTRPMTGLRQPRSWHP